MERAELLNEVRTQVDVWIGARASRSLTALAREAGVSESCVRRLYNTNSIPQNDNLMKILMVLSEQTSIENLRKFFVSQKSVIHFLVSNYSFLETSSYINECKPLLAEEVYIEDYHAFLVYALSCNRVGVSVDEIKNMLGFVGEMALDDLMSKGLVSLNPDNYLKPKIRDVRPSKELIKKHLPEITKMFFKLDNHFNCHVLQTETVSKKGYGLAMDAFEKFLAEVGNVIQDHPGEVPIVIGGFLDTLTLKPYFKEESK